MKNIRHLVFASLFTCSFLHNPIASAQNLVLVPLNPGTNLSGIWDLQGAALPDAKVNKPYTYPFLGLISRPNYSGFTWSSTLPPSIASWATLNPTTGVLSGTPTAPDLAGTNFTIVATRKGKNDQTIYTLKIGNATLDAVQISAGQSHTCAVTTSGGAKCWGSNGSYQLGDGSTSQRIKPVDVIGLTAGVSSISAGYNHTCAVTSGGGAKCWGANSNGELGDGTTSARSTPVNVVGMTLNTSSIGAGNANSCALTSSGGVKCWGNNANGRLGDGTTTNSLTPVDVIGLTSGVVSLSVGLSHSCVKTSGGGAKCWGNNSSGRLGDGTTTQRPTPVDVIGFTSNVHSIITGAATSCLITTGGGAKCWGFNGGGRLGDGTQVERHFPVDVVGLGSGVSSISSGISHTCAVTTSGGAKCWGGNSTGQIGDGTTTDRLTPVNVFELQSGATSISAGGSQTCAITNDEIVKCWGTNSNGQLGDGTLTQRITPVFVIP